MSQYRSCEVCRQRKKKCIYKPNQSDCEYCLHLAVPCIRTKKPASAMRRETAKLKAQKVLHQVAQQAYTSSPPDFDVEVDMDMDDGTEGEFPENSDALAVYRETVEPSVPFLDPVVLDDPQLLNEAAPFIALARMNFKAAYYGSKLTGLLEDLDYRTASYSLILLCRVYLSPALFQQILSKIVSAQPIPLAPDNVAVGVLVSSLWYELLDLCNNKLNPIDSNIARLWAFQQTLDSTSFAFQYLKITILACKSLKRSRDRRELLSLEYEFLLWSLHVPPNLIDLRDEMPGNPQSRILHILFNTVLFDFYQWVLLDKELSTLTRFKPIPIIIHFMNTLAVSVFKCPKYVVDRWEFLSDCQAKVASMMIQIVQLSDSENSKQVLSTWKDIYGRYPDLQKRMHETIGSGPWVVEKLHGYSVFWTFRDTRSLHVEDMLSSV